MSSTVPQHPKENDASSTVQSHPKENNVSSTVTPHPKENDKNGDIIYDCPSTSKYANKTHSENGNNVDFCMSMQNLTFPEMHESDTAFLESLFSDNPKSDNFVTLTHESQSVSVELNETRPIKNKPLTYFNPGCYKRRITNFLVSTLENSEIETPLQNSTKQELINTFKSKKLHVIKVLIDFIAHIQKICVFEQNYRRNDKRREKRRKPKNSRPPIENVQTANECFTSQIIKDQLNLFDNDLFLRLISENFNYDIFGEEANFPSESNHEIANKELDHFANLT